MALGYLSGGAPDGDWWMEQVHGARLFRKEFARQSKWNDWRQYYRGRFARDQLPINLFFSMLRTTVPRVYFRNPAVSVSPAMPGFLNMAFAMVLNRIDNKLIRQMKVKDEAKDMVHDGFLFGTLIGKLGFGAEHNYAGHETDAPEAKGSKRGRERIEYDHRVLANTPWFRRVPTGRYLVPKGTVRQREARWVAHEITRTKEDVKRDPRLKNTSNLVATREVSHEFNFSDTKLHDDMDRVDVVEMIEIYDMKTGKVLLIAPHSDRGGRVLLEEDSAFPTPPFFSVAFNSDDQVFWGVPDAQILEPQQLEINEINTQAMKHRRIAIVKLLIGPDAMEESEIAKMTSEDVAAVIRTKVDPNQAVSKFLLGDIPPSLSLAEREVMQNVRETLGFSRNALGEFQPGSEKPTAEETATVRQGSEIRVDERRDMLGDMITDMVSMMNDTIFAHWDQEQVVEVVGPGGAQVWVKVNPRDLGLGSYQVRVDPDSQLPQTREQRAAKAAGVYNILKTNPLIDPQRLTQYLLTELGGVQLDELMRALPPPQQSPNGPVNPGQLAGLIAQSAGKANPEQAARVIEGDR